MLTENNFKPITTYHSQIIARYQQKTQQHQRILMLIKELFPPSLVAHVLHCSVTSNKLFIYTDASLWASQLRFYQQAILNTLMEANMTAIHTVQIKILPPSQPKKQLQTRCKPSETNLQLLRHCSDNVKDERLQNALLKLAQRLETLP